MNVDVEDPRWTLMGRSGGTTVYEDFTDLRGGIALVTEDGTTYLPKSAEPSWWEGSLPADVFTSDHDVLGEALLRGGGDPDRAAVAAALPPIATMYVHSFVGMPDNPDKVGVTLGGATANVDPAQHQPGVTAVRDAGRVLDGLVGGWLPILRFVYPDDTGWTELLLFAPPDRRSGNARIQPVWYRITRVEDGRPVAVTYVDSYPLHASDEPGDFYADLLATRAYWVDELAPAMTLDIPDRALADQARHSLVRARMTRIDDWPKYGVLDRNYGGSEHDGFQDTFTVDVAAALDWGLFDVAGRYLDNYLTHFVRDDGSIVYRGPGTGQYGRMLTVLARHHAVTGDPEILRRHGKRVDAIADLLRDKPREHGIIVGWCEADSCLEADPGRYQVPYLSNSAEAVRGWADLAAAYAGTGRADRAAALRAESDAMRRTLHDVIERSVDRSVDPPWLPVVAGDPVPFHEAVPADDHHPQFRAYRANGELLHSGVLTAAQVDTIVSYRRAHGDIVLGAPAAYNHSRDPDFAHGGRDYGNRELAGFLSYQHAYGLIQHDRVEEYLLALYCLAAHQYTRGTWTAPETRRVRPGSPTAGYCTPAQLVVPLLLRWALVFEEPDADVLWLGRAVPRGWFADGEVIEVAGAPTRFGRVGFRIEVRDGRFTATLDLPAGPVGKLRLRCRPGDVTVNGKPTEPDGETITLSAPGRYTVEGTASTGRP